MIIVDCISPEEFKSLLAIGADCTNIGPHGGDIALIEKKLKRKCHWNICILHMNELPMKKIFTALDGKTRVPNLHSGPIGVFLNNCRDRPPDQFIPINLPRGYHSDLLNNTYLSSDQEYLRDMIIAISSGVISNNLACRSPSKLGYVRWLTIANRILSLNVTYESPTTDFKIICNYIINVYART